MVFTYSRCFDDDDVITAKLKIFNSSSVKEFTTLKLNSFENL